MKSQRHTRILEIISEKDIETQEQLLDELKADGLSCTQATISRDIKELRIVKELTSMGNYRYAAPSQEAASSFSGRLNSIFKQCVTGVDHAQNIVVIKTLPGLAAGACSAIDAMQMSVVVGSLAGDDTAVIIMRDINAAVGFCSEIKKLLND